jgi:hypothetical protein
MRRQVRVWERVYSPQRLLAPLQEQEQQVLGWVPPLDLELKLVGCCYSLFES